MTEPYYQDEKTIIHHGDCLEVMADMPAESIDAIVTDPPYGLGFMGNKWDHMPPGKEWAEACLRVLKPGGHLLAFGGSRTWHRLAVAIEDGGFEIRDSIAWLYGSGFPKSMNVSKAIDKAARGVPQGGADPTSPNHGKYRTTTTEGKRWNGDSGQGYGAGGSRFLTEAGRASGSATEPAESGGAETAAEAAQWEGWGTALKPAFEPVVVARKPFTGTVAANVLEHGTGALNIDACRIGMSDDDRAIVDSRSGAGDATEGWGNIGKRSKGQKFKSSPSGRWPANVVLDEHCAGVLDQQSGNLPSQKTRAAPRKGTAETASHLGSLNGTRGSEYLGESGGASRFFYIARKDNECPSGSGLDAPFMYCAKAPKRERPNVDGVAHPTVKPLSLMRWLVRMVTPPGGTVLDPFAGSGTTIEAALTEGFNSIGIELTDEYLPLIQRRIERATETTMF